MVSYKALNTKAKKINVKNTRKKRKNEKFTTLTAFFLMG